MLLRLGTLAVCLSLLGWVSAFDVRGRINFATNTTMPLGCRAILDRGAKSVLIQHDGAFVVYDVANGEHVLETDVPGYSFQTVFLTINSPEIHIQTYHPARLPAQTTIPSLSHPLVLSPLGKEDYYTAPPGANILGLLKSPMVLMMLFTGGMMFAMPKLMASMDMDPEMAKDMAETRKKMQGVQNMDFMGSLSNILAGTTEESSPVAATSIGTSTPPTPQRNGNSAGGKKKKNR